MFWQNNKKKIDFSSLIFDSRNFVAASLKTVLGHLNNDTNLTSHIFILAGVMQIYPDYIFQFLKMAKQF